MRLEEFVNNVDMAELSSRINLAKRFGKFLFEKIGDKINEDGMSQAILDIAEREQRANVNITDLTYKIAAAHQYPASGDFGSALPLFPDGNNRMTVPVYGDEFTEAYMVQQSERMRDDVFRIVTVKLMDPMVFECIKYSLNMFNSERLGLEAKKQTDRLAELEQLRSVVVQARDTYMVSPEEEP